MALIGKAAGKPVAFCMAVCISILGIALTE